MAVGSPAPPVATLPAGCEGAFPCACWAAFVGAGCDGADVAEEFGAALALAAAGLFAKELGWTGVIGVDGVGVAGGSALSVFELAAAAPFFCGRFVTISVDVHRA